jgi:hypothetical protein
MSATQATSADYMILHFLVIHDAARTVRMTYTEATAGKDRQLAKHI